MKSLTENFALIEKNTYMVCGITSSLTTANFLIERSLGLFFIVPYAQLRQGFDELKCTPWLSSFDTEKSHFKKNDFDLNQTEIDYWSFFNEKITALDKIARNLQTQKNRYKGNNNDLTDLILITREFQAKQVIGGDLTDCCYVEKYAEGNGLSLLQAAEDIVIKSRLMHTDLANIEGMKYKYFNQIYDANATQIDSIMRKFHRECWFSNLC